MTRSCKFCGGPLPPAPPPPNHRRKERLYCCRACRVEAWRERHGMVRVRRPGRKKGIRRGVVRGMASGRIAGTFDAHDPLDVIEAKVMPGVIGKLAAVERPDMTTADLLQLARRAYWRENKRQSRAKFRAGITGKLRAVEAPDTITLLDREHALAAQMRLDARIWRQRQRMTEEAA